MGKDLENRTVSDARELARYIGYIAAHSETRFSEVGQLLQVGAGYTFLWRCRPMAEQRNPGVVFGMRNDIMGRLKCLQLDTNDL
ncbi:unnamed protein product [Schistocephalus solidus]|uniref:Uncharacterized protein n=1 Tax=Schistocephalus solidus TaxID=70667 RepID=A0A183SMY2_SCHSO|nr:unnamed protein product [Schistocephalus solidus]